MGDPVGADGIVFLRILLEDIVVEGDFIFVFQGNAFVLGHGLIADFSGEVGGFGVALDDVALELDGRGVDLGGEVLDLELEAGGCGIRGVLLGPLFRLFGFGQFDHVLDLGLTEVEGVIVDYLFDLVFHVVSDVGVEAKGDAEHSADEADATGDAKPDC